MADVTYNTAGVEHHNGDLLTVIHDIDIAASGDTIPRVGLRSVLRWGSDKPADVTACAFTYSDTGASAALTTTGAVANVKMWFDGYP